MTNRTHIDLCSGIGGFALACKWLGVETIQFVEIDQRCCEFLSKTYPGVPIHDDIKTFKWNSARPVWLLTGGIPCQPSSRAGKQRGSADDRWLWGEAIRCLSDIKPTWALFENPPGIGDVGLRGILSDMESEGYEVRVFSIPACAVNAPHRRERYWIVAHNNEDQYNRRGRQDSKEDGISQVNREAIRSGMFGGAGQGGMADTETPSRIGLQNGEELKTSSQNGRCCPEQWRNHVWLPCADGKVRRAPDDTFGLVDGLHRSVLGALGNSIVPQVAYEIIKAMIEAD